MSWVPSPAKKKKKKAIPSKTPKKGLCTKGSDGILRERKVRTHRKAKKKLQDQENIRRMVIGYLQKKQKETERIGRNEHENRKVIIITRHMTATTP